MFEGEEPKGGGVYRAVRRGRERERGWCEGYGQRGMRGSMALGMSMQNWVCGTSTLHAALPFPKLFLYITKKNFCLGIVWMCDMGPDAFVSLLLSYAISFPLILF